MNEFQQMPECLPREANMRLDVVNHAQGVNGLIERRHGHVGRLVGVGVEYPLFFREERIAPAGPGKKVQGFPDALGAAPEPVHVIEEPLAAVVCRGIDVDIRSRGQGGLPRSFPRLGGIGPRLADGRKHLAGNPVGEGVGFGLGAAEGQLVHGRLGNEAHGACGEVEASAQLLPVIRDAVEHLPLPAHAKASAYVGCAEPRFGIFGEGTNLVGLENEDLRHGGTPFCLFRADVGSVHKERCRVLKRANGAPDLFPLRVFYSSTPGNNDGIYPRFPGHNGKRAKRKPMLSGWRGRRLVFSAPYGHATRALPQMSSARMGSGKVNKSMKKPRRVEPGREAA